MPAACLGEGSHHDVHISGIHPQLLAHAAAAGAQRADAMRLIQVQIALQEGWRRVRTAVSTRRVQQALWPPNLMKTPVKLLSFPPDPSACSTQQRLLATA